MEIFNIDFSLIPWPLFILLIFVIFCIFWYLHIHIPMSEELTEYKENLSAKVTELEKTLVDYSAILETVQKDQNGISNKIHARFDKLEVINLDLTKDFDKSISRIESEIRNILSVDDKISDKVDSIENKLYILISSNPNQFFSKFIENEKNRRSE